MTRESSAKQVFEEILSTQDYERLERFKNVESWVSMNEEERHTLALLFLLVGEEKLEDGEEDPIDFHYARQICPDDPYIPYRIALAWIETPEEPCYAKAIQCIKETIHLDPVSHEPWFLWGKLLCDEGVEKQDYELLISADEKFKKAKEFLSEDGIELEFYWRWGMVWHYIAKHSGEAADYRVAVDHYMNAHELGLDQPKFQNDLGNAHVDLSCLINQSELLGDAVVHYHLAIKKQPGFFEAWLNLACTYQKLHEINAKEKYFLLSNECFRKAAQIETGDESLWFKWGQLLLSEGKRVGNPKFVSIALLKFQKLSESNPNAVYIQSKLAECDLSLGILTGELEYLKGAEKRILKVVQQFPEYSFTWLIYGNCLAELGRYFQDETFFERAVEVFLQGLATDKKDPHLWTSLALATYSLGLLRSESDLFEKACQNFAKAAEYGGATTPNFWNDWGVACLRIAQTKEDENAVESAIDKFGTAIDFFQNENDLSAVPPEWIYNLGCAFDFLGDYTSEPSDYEQAIGFLKQVIVLDPKFVAAYHNLGLALVHLGETVEEPEILLQAFPLYQKVIELEPEEETIWNDYAVAIITHCEMTKETFQIISEHNGYEEAKTKLIQSIALGNEYAYYNLACVESILGAGIDEVLSILNRAKQADTLPPIEEIEKDEWLRDSLTHPKLKEFLEELRVEAPPRQS